MPLTEKDFQDIRKQLKESSAQIGELLKVNTTHAISVQILKSQNDIDTQADSIIKDAIAKSIPKGQNAETGTLGWMFNAIEGMFSASAPNLADNVKKDEALRELLVLMEKSNYNLEEARAFNQIAPELPKWAENDEKLKAFKEKIKALEEQKASHTQKLAKQEQKANAAMTDNKSIFDKKMDPIKNENHAILSAKNNEELDRLILKIKETTDINTMNLNNAILNAKDNEELDNAILALAKSSGIPDLYNSILNASNADKNNLYKAILGAITTTAPNKDKPTFTAEDLQPGITALQKKFKELEDEIKKPTTTAVHKLELINQREAILKKIEEMNHKLTFSDDAHRNPNEATNTPSQSPKHKR